MSTIFSDPKLAGDVGTFFFFIPTFLYFISEIEALKKRYVGFLISIFTQPALNYSFFPIKTDDGVVVFSGNDALIMLIADVFIYFILYIYMDLVLPNEYGIKKHPLFFIKDCFKSKAKFERGISVQMDDQSLLSRTYSENIGKPQYEEKLPDTFNNEALVKIFNLQKKFGETKAVDGISLNLYKNNLLWLIFTNFSLLGHNGAGKTTTINLITGILNKSSGKIYSSL